MDAKKQFTQIANFADKLEESIKNESLEDAALYSQQWDTKIRTLIRSLSAEQFIAMDSQIKSLASKNSSIKKCLVKLRAKVLTQLQENNNSRTAIEQYQNIA